MTGLTFWQRVRIVLGARISVAAPPMPTHDTAKGDDRTERYFQCIGALRTTWGTVIDRLRVHVDDGALQALELGIPAAQLHALLDELDRLERVGSRAIVDGIMERKDLDSTILDRTHEVFKLQKEVTMLQRQLADAKTPPEALLQRRAQQLSRARTRLSELHRAVDSLLHLWMFKYMLSSPPPPVELQNAFKDLLPALEAARKVLDESEVSGRADP